MTESETCNGQQPTLTHRVAFRPAYDKRDPNPSKSYGIHGMEITFYVIGPEGAIQWNIYTNWHVASARKHLEGFPRSTYDDPWRPSGYDLGYHSKRPLYDGQEPRDNCHLVDGGVCYYDGSGLNAELPIEGFLNGGEDWLWPKLEAYYAHTFLDAPWPFEAEVEARERRRYI